MEARCEDYCGFNGRRIHKTLLALILTAAWGFINAAHGAYQVPAIQEPIAQSTDVTAGADFCRIDDLVEEAIRENRLPGAVILIGRHQQVLYRKAFGYRAVVPALEPMTVDTIFDLASLTKVVATTPAVMKLIEDGRISLEDPVARYIPNFERHGKSNITVRHLLTHTSGLRPGLNPALQWKEYREAIDQIVDDMPVSPPGERIVYSDLNFILLGGIVRRVSGMSLDRFAHDYFYQPLGMRDTMFEPPAILRSRIAPTERCRNGFQPCGGPDGVILRGQVHDPAARRMGGVAGHAGLFSTADDLAVFCRMMLNGGAFGQTRVLTPATIGTMLSPSTPLNDGYIRALGWSLDITCNDCEEKHSAPPVDHSGFTGTKLWLHPASGLYVIFLSSRLHPDGEGDVFDLRENVVTVAVNVAMGGAKPAEPRSGSSAATMRRPNVLPDETQHPGRVFSGIDVLREENFDRAAGRRIGLLTNQTGRARDGAGTVDLFYKASNLHLTALFSPEHGLHGTYDDRVPSARDKKTGLTIHSLYGKRLRPTAEMLAGIDTIVVDLQDIGTRYYTYMTTMAYMLEAAAAQNIKFMVLDRPNPINGLQIEGPLLNRELTGFAGYFPMPVRHGLTMGELARLFNGENNIGAYLTVVKMRGWQRQYWFDETGLPWINPSPNMRNLIQATLYPGIGAIEGTRISVGRGTDTPFEQIGAPWVAAVQLASELNARELAGVRFYPVSFTPQSSKFAGTRCQGVFILVTDRQVLQPVRLGLEVASVLHRLYPADYLLEQEDRLLGSATVLSRVLAGEDPADIARSWQADEKQWQKMRSRYLLY